MTVRARPELESWGFVAAVGLETQRWGKPRNSRSGEHVKEAALAIDLDVDSSQPHCSVAHNFLSKLNFP